MFSFMWFGILLLLYPSFEVASIFGSASQFEPVSVVKGTFLKLGMVGASRKIDVPLSWLCANFFNFTSASPDCLSGVICYQLVCGESSNHLSLFSTIIIIVHSFHRLKGSIKKINASFSNEVNEHQTAIVKNGSIHFRMRNIFENDLNLYGK